MGKKEPKRRAWRKKTKTDDVESALEDERMVNKMKQGGKSKLDPLLGELFTVDTKGSFEGISARSRREIARAKLFPPKGPNLGLSATEKEKIEQLHFKLELRRTPAPRRAPEVFDMWAEPSAPAGEASASWFSSIRRVPKPVPRTAPKTLSKKLSAAPAVIPAHEGQSMNPESGAYEDLACLAAAQQLEREHEAEDLARRLAPMTAELKDALGAEAVDAMDDEAKIRAYRALVCTTTGDETAQGEDGEGGLVNPPVQNKRKSQAIRNREKKRKYIVAEEAQRRQQKKLERSVGEIGAILKDMRREEQVRKLRKQYKATAKAKQQELERQGNPFSRARKIGRMTFAEEAMPVPKLQDGKQAMRSQTLKGASAVKDRLASILRRGLLPAPPTASHEQIEQRKLKNYKMKRSHKFLSPLLRENLLLR